MNRLFLKRKNNMRNILSGAFLLICFFTQAADIKYPVSSIPEGLKKNADVVKRMEESEFEILNTKETRLHYKYALTILNENGSKYAVFSEMYDKLRHVGSVEGYLYDERGNLIKKMKSKDLSDQSAVSEFIDDNRVKEYSFYHNTYPYTVEFEASITFDHTFYFPSWSPQEYTHLSVEKAKFIVITPQDYIIRYKAFNYKGEPLQSTEKNKKVYTWSAENIPAINREPYAPRWHEITTTISIAPTEFEVQGMKGNMTSWKEFGKFIYELKKNREELPNDTKQKIISLTANAQTDIEKIQLLYRFLQQNTRYISIQLGIGGWQPFDATYVSKKGYGDCKALSNYMYSLLKAVGIKSYYTLVKAGDYDHYLMDDFPSNQFNHVILCVPLKKDTMWLECTSQTIAPGYMSEFTGNRNALLIDEEGGVLVSTPRYGLRENLLVRQVKSLMDIEGNLNMKVSTRYSGVQQDDLSMMINALSKEKLEKILQRDLELASYNINDFKYQETKAILPELNEQLDISVNNYGIVSGKRLFICPNLLNRSDYKFTPDDKRTVDIVFYGEWRDEDDYEIEIPEGYQLETIPQAVSSETKFGTYTSSTKLDGNKIIYHRVREQFSGRFPAKDQAELTKFFEDIYKADRARVVLVKKAE
jgi:transglutaminase-like putative cysteine protease